MILGLRLRICRFRAERKLFEASDSFIPGAAQIQATFPGRSQCDLRVNVRPGEVALLVALVERAFDEALLVGVAGGLGAVRDAQLAVDVREVELDGLGSDPELLRDRGVGLALCECGQDRELS